jgi:hypothetical protein
VPPLEAVDWAQVPGLAIQAETGQVLFGAISRPDFDVFLLKQLCISGAADEPQKFLGHAPPKHLLVC